MASTFNTLPEHRDMLSHKLEQRGRDWVCVFTYPDGIREFHGGGGDGRNGRWVAKPNDPAAVITNRVPSRT